MANSSETYGSIEDCVAHIEGLKEAFNKRAAPRDEKERIRELLWHLCDIDQYVRFYAVNKFPHFESKEIDQRTHRYKLPADFTGDDEERSLIESLFPIWQRIDEECTEKLKEELKKREWFPISEFGEDVSLRAWLITQHADLDPAFQKKVLGILERLYPIGEARPRDYAYLYDRVAVSHYDPSKRTPQRYGTQGDSFPVEDPKHLKQRQKKMGLDFG